MSETLQHGVTIGIFVAVFVGILTEVFEKGVVAVTGALLCLLLGIITQGEAESFIDFETLSLLLGMMVVVGVAADSGLFEYVSIAILKITRGRPLAIFLFFMINTLLLSSVLNNVTTILIMLPLTLEMTRGIGINPKPFVLGEIFFANIGGLLTLIGDPVNTIVGSAANLGMIDFMVNMSIPVFAHTATILLFLYVVNRSQFRDIGDNFIKLFHNQLVIQSINDRFEKKGIDWGYDTRSSIVLVLTIICFLMSGILGLSAGAIALVGAAVALLACHKKVEFESVLHSIEWKTLLFFLGLFVVVGAVEKTGVLDTLAHALMGLTSSPYLLIGILLIGTGIVSAFVDNIPFVTIMIPIVRTIQEGGLFPNNPEVLWFALCLGAVMGGMASPFGSSANIVAIGCADRCKYHISTPYYLRTSLIVSAMGLVIAYAYLVLAYEF